MSMAQQAARGAAWAIALSLGARIIGVCGTLVMTGFLTPDEIGEVSAASILAFTASWLTTWGFGPYAVVKGRGPDALEVTFHATVAYVVLGIIGLGGIALVSTSFSELVDVPRAGHFIPGMALAIFIRRLGAMPERVLTRRMQFRPIGIANALGELAYAVTAVTLAARGWSGEAMIVGNIVQSTLATALLIRAAGWAEWATPVKLRWSRFRDMLIFGLPLALESVAHNASRYWDNLAISHLFGSRATGLYNLAYNLADIPATQVGEQLTLVLLPSMANLPPERRPRALERATALLSLIIFPMAIGLGLVAVPLVDGFMAKEWWDVAPLLSILACMSVFRPVTWVLAAYMEAQERTTRLMFLEVGKLILLVVLIFALAPLGLHWSAAAVGISFGVHAVVGVLMVSHEGPSPRRMLLGFAQPLVACGAMAAAILAIRPVVEPLPLLVQFAIEVVLGAGVYVAVALVVAKDTAKDFLGLVRGMRRRRASSQAEPPAPDSIS